MFQAQHPALTVVSLTFVHNTYEVWSKQLSKSHDIEVAKTGGQEGGKKGERKKE